MLDMHALSSAAAAQLVEDARARGDAVMGCERGEEVEQALLETDVPSPYAHQRLSPAPSLFATPGNNSPAKAPPAARARRVSSGDVTNGQSKPPQRVPRPGSAPGRPSLKGVGSAVVAAKRIRRVSAGDVTSGISGPFTPKLQAVNEGSISPPSAAGPAQPHQAMGAAVAKGRAKPAERKRRATAPDVMSARPGSRPVASPIRRSSSGSDQAKRPQELIDLVHLFTEALRVRAEEMKAFVCELCGGMLMQPTPLSPCAHVLCGACHTATVGSGFVECPACFKPILKQPHTTAQPLLGGKEPLGAGEASGAAVAELSPSDLAEAPLPAAGEVAWRGGAVDEAHDEALRRRLEAALRSIGSQQDRAEWKGLVMAAQAAQGAATTEAEQATRLILEFGTELPSGYTEAAPFCRIVEVRRGSAAAPLPTSLRSGSLGQLVHSVELRKDTKPSPPSPPKAEKAADGNYYPLNGKQGGGASPTRAAPLKRHLAVVTWAEALKLPPLEIRFAPSLADCWPIAPGGEGTYDGGVAVDLRSSNKSDAATGGQPASGSGGCCRRRLIVQLPTVASNGKPTVAEEVAAGVGGLALDPAQPWVYDANGEAGTPAVAVPPLPSTSVQTVQSADAVAAPQGGGQMSSGWVVAESGGVARAHHGSRDFGRIPFAPYGGAAVRKLLGASSPCTGTVTESTLQLLPIVLVARPLAELVASGMADLTPLARSIVHGTSGGSHGLTSLYDEMQRHVAAILAQRPTAQPSTGLRLYGAALPRGLFHVAIDLPGHGRSPGDARAMDEKPEALPLPLTLRALTLLVTLTLTLPQLYP